MPNTTIYIKDSDLAVVKKAKKLLGDSLSATFVDCLKGRIEASKTGMTKITLLFFDKREEPTERRSFVGKWLVGDNEAGLQTDTPVTTALIDTGVQFSVALTKQGRFVVYRTHRTGLRYPTMDVHDSFNDLRDFEYADRLNNRKLGYPPSLIAAVSEALDEPVETFMDI